MTQKERVCKGKIGFVRQNNSSSNYTEGIEMTCPDGTDFRFPTGDRKSAVQQARRVLNRKGYDADLVDKEGDLF